MDKSLNALAMARQARGMAKDILTWNWTKRLLYWIVLSAGTMAECVFLVASLWVTINASVHSFVLVFMPEQTTVHLTQLATVAYVGLPECILALAIVTTLSHIRTWLYNKRDMRALTWSILYGLPTVIFLILSLITIGCSMLQVDFQLPGFMIVTRGLAGYSYGLIALLYSQLGLPQERDRLQQKDGTIAELREQHAMNLAELREQHETMLANMHRSQEEMAAKHAQDNAVFTAKIESQTSEATTLKSLLSQSQTAQIEMQKALHKSSEDALEALPEGVALWVAQGVKTASIDAINQHTGHSKQKIRGAITRGMLQTSQRNKELIMVASLVPWLKSVGPSTGKTEELPILHIVPPLARKANEQ